MKPPTRFRPFILFLGAVFLLIETALWINVFSYNDRRQETIRQRWIESQLQHVRTVSKEIRSWLDAHIQAGESFSPQTQQEIIQMLVSPMGFYSQSAVWVYSPNRVIYDSRLSNPSQILTIQELFAIQTNQGADHFTELIQAVQQGGEGTGWHIYSAARGREYAAWTTIQVLNETWTIGMSTPENEIYQLAGLKTEYVRNLVWSGGFTALLAAIFLLMFWQKITDQHTMEQLEESVTLRTAQLASSEKRYRTLVENLQEGIAILEPGTHKLVYTSPALRRIFQLPPDAPDNTQFNPLRLIPKELHELIFKLSIKKTSDQHPGIVVQAQTAQGKPLWLEVSSNQVELENQVLDMLLFADVTERTQTEDALRESEERYRGIFNNVQDAILLEDALGNIVGANQSACAMFGYSLEEFLTKNVRDIARPEYIHVIAKDAESLANQLPKQPIEAINIRANGSYFPVEISACLFTLKENPVSLVAVRDISDRKQAEELIRKTNEQLDRIMSSVPDALWSGVINPEGIYSFQYVSPVIKYITGIPAENFLSNPFLWDSIIHPDDLEHVKQVRFSLANGLLNATDNEIRIALPDGSYRWVRDSIQAYPAPNGLIRLDGVLSDISDRKQVEQTLQETNQELTNTINILEQRNHEITLLNELNNLLQSSLSVRDAFSVISTYAVRLFPKYSGSLSIYDPAQDHLENAVTWGEDSLGETSYPSEHCWGLRRGRLHLSEPYNQGGLRCRHLDTSDQNAICIPLNAQGEGIGLLTLQCPAGGMNDRHQQVAESLAGQLALALSNLRLRETLRMQAIRDPLTGLYNRHYLEEMLDNEIKFASQEKRPLTLLILDIDNFKMYNERLGRSQGDEILRSIAHFLQSSTNTNDFVCRFGGDEFIVLIRSAIGEEVLLKHIDSLRITFSQLDIHHTAAGFPPLTLSIGLAYFPQHGTNSQEIFQSLDLALRQARYEGGNRLVTAQKV